MHKSLLSFVAVFFFIYGSASFYVGLRLWQALINYFPTAHTLLYTAFFCLLTLAYPLGRLGDGLLPFGLTNALTILGAYWLACLYYLFLLLILFAILRFLDHYTGILPVVLKSLPTCVLCAVVITAGLIAYGVWNARSPVIRHYDITIAKSTGGLSQLHAVMVSDIHSGKIVDTARLSRMVDTINQLNPDIVFLPGDIIDEDVDLFAARNMPDVLRRLRPPLGVYGVLGNHEYIGRKPELAMQELSQSGIAVLRDQYVQIAGGIYVIGRDDRSQEQAGGRKSLPEIMTGIDQSLPIILLDHQPFDLYQAEAAGVDLQLSGHTHLGQFFPNNLLTHAIYELDWGYLRKNSLQVIVSCGFGTWGPPIRIGNQPEIVDITINFTPTCISSIAAPASPADAVNKSKVNAGQYM